LFKETCFRVNAHSPRRKKFCTCEIPRFAGDFRTIADNLNNPANLELDLPPTGAV
jgi:hypothetical protein